MSSGDDLEAAFAARVPDALGRAYEAHARALYAVARHVLADAAAAQDCVHDALLRAWQAPRSYRPELGPLRTFLIACVRNEALSALRASGRRSAREERAERLQPVREATFDVVDHVEADRVRRALAALPADQRGPLELVYYGNRSHVQAALELGLPLGTLKGRLAAAIRRLQTLLATPEGAL